VITIRNAVQCSPKHASVENGKRKKPAKAQCAKVLNLISSTSLIAFETSFSFLNPPFSIAGYFSVHTPMRHDEISLQIKSHPANLM